MLQLKGLSELQLLPDCKIVKASNYAALVDAEAMIAEARRNAEEIVSKAQAAYEAEKARGLKEGQDEARQQAAQQMMDTITRGVDYLAKMEEQVIGVVMLALRRIVGELDEKELITRVVTRALEVMRTQKQVTVRVAPTQVDAVRSQLDQILSNFSGINFLDLVADSRLKPGGCILETEIGVVDASLDVQIEAIRKSLAKLMKGNPDH